MHHHYSKPFCHLATIKNIICYTFLYFKLLIGMVIRTFNTTYILGKQNNILGIDEHLTER